MCRESWSVLFNPFCSVPQRSTHVAQAMGAPPVSRTNGCLFTAHSSHCQLIASKLVCKEQENQCLALPKTNLPASEMSTIVKRSWQMKTLPSPFTNSEFESGPLCRRSLLSLSNSRRLVSASPVIPNTARIPHMLEWSSRQRLVKCLRVCLPRGKKTHPRVANSFQKKRPHFAECERDLPSQVFAAERPTGPHGQVSPSRGSLTGCCVSDYVAHGQ